MRECWIVSAWVYTRVCESECVYEIMCEYHHIIGHPRAYPGVPVFHEKCNHRRKLRWLRLCWYSRCVLPNSFQYFIFFYTKCYKSMTQLMVGAVTRAIKFNVHIYLDNLNDTLKGYRTDWSVISIYIKRVHLWPHNIRAKRTIRPITIYHWS